MYAKQPMGEPAQVLDYLAPYTLKVARLAVCRALFGRPAPALAALESVDVFMARVAQMDLTRSSHCADGRMRVIAALAPLRRIHTPRLSTGPPL